MPHDDQAKPANGVANGRNIVADPDLLVLVGHYTGVALPASEVYKEHMLAMISPANTAIEITDRGYPNVNRVCGRDDVQGPVDARRGDLPVDPQSFNAPMQPLRATRSFSPSFPND